MTGTKGVSLTQGVGEVWRRVRTVRVGLYAVTI